MADTMLPPEYQEQLDLALRKQKIAQFLQQQAMNRPAPQSQGNIAAKISPLAGLAGLAQVGVGGYLGNQALDETQNVRRRYAADENNAVQNFTDLQNSGTPTGEKDAQQFGQTSVHPRVQAMAKELQAKTDARRQASATALSTGGYTQQALDTLNGAPTAPIPPRKASELRSFPDPDNPSKKVQIIVNYDDKGVEHWTSANGQNINVNLPGDEAKDQIKINQQELSDARTKAQEAQLTLANNERTIESLRAGAGVGGGAAIKQAGRKFAQAFGVNFPETGPTDETKALLTAALASKAKTFGANPTNVEDQYVKDLVGTIDTDPSALPKLIAYTTAQAHKHLQDFGDFVKTKRENWTAQPLSKNYPGLYDTADTGLTRGPSKLFGPQDFQMTVIKALKQAGGDISRFNAPAEKGQASQPFDSNSNFEGIGLSPIGQSTATPPNSAALPLTPAEQQELIQLRKQLKR